ncbi:MAG: hypothetical protein KKE02_19195 [Alphaproteobacteria bacterium]|nr:hypothetical protein [Alphaproteobacteria bacterium]MBU1517243.1 hypothetical protein [Alphaproteobacteria bacterium]MBU2093221.1 hypothetical protein [Alphaproteobacteria bacterium]MBU2153153.1 hypothetical protein [Alphaproteobacteria bacterium]MBU2307859.1 hypothetical protein [Alphaproteobacteria bacterium]
MPDDHADRAERLGPYFEVQLRLARRMTVLTGRPLGETAVRFTNFYRRLGFGVPDGPPSIAWLAYARALEAAPDAAAQVALSQATCAANPPERPPIRGQTGFGCFACETPGEDGGVRLHFYNLDTDAQGGPLAAAKMGRRREELAALVRHLDTAHPEATCIRGKSWLYNLDAYRRLFPPDYGASRTIALGPLNLNGTSSWGQLIDSHERIRPQVRDTLISNLERLDPDAPWLAFPNRVLKTEAPLSSFRAFLGL